MTPDVAYCDRYWECVDGQPELYDCPNGLVYAGKHRGVTEGCDYPWRADYCDGKTQASKSPAVLTVSVATGAGVWGQGEGEGRPTRTGGGCAERHWDHWGHGGYSARSSGTPLVVRGG